VLLIVLVALFLPWLRMNALVSVGERLASRAEAEAWIRADPTGADRGPDGGPVERAGILARRYTSVDLAMPEALPDFVRRSAEKLAETGTERQTSYWRGFELHFRYALVENRDPDGAIYSLVVLDRQSSAANLLAINTLYLISAGCIVLALAVLVFYLITHRLILQPVRRLKTVAERVREGDISTRAAIETGDEFEELSETFNAMLGELQKAQERMRTTNAALDLKVSELSERNSALFEAAKVKGQFLANVSHELRTPMNSVIGFGELLLEIAYAEQQAGDDSTRLEKRIRYLDNIVSAARQLLEMINGLLEMAKIEAGKAELNVDQVGLAEACEGLVGLIYPLARRRGIEVKLEVSPDTPT
jgi:signal transduction histidine kinase